MRRYKRKILQGSTMEGLIEDIRFAFDFEGPFEIEGEIKTRFEPIEHTTGYYVVLRKRLSFWQWLKCVFGI